MQDIVLIPIPITELEDMIAKCVKEALRYPPVQESKEPLLTEHQAAQFLDIPLVTLHTLIKKCEIPIRTKGRRCYFSKEDLELWQLRKKQITYGNTTSKYSRHGQAHRGC